MLVLITQPLDSRNRNRYALDYWLEITGKVTVFDFTNLLYPSKSKFFTEQGGQLDICKFDYYSPRSIYECLSIAFTSSVQHKYYFDYTNSESLIEIVKLILAWKSLRRIKVFNGLLPRKIKFVKRKRTYLTNFINFLGRKYNLKHVIKRLLERLLSRFYCLFVKSDYYVATSDGCLKIIPSATSKENIIYACSFDYDIYLEASRSLNCSNNSITNTAVFLDGDLCYHPDFITSDSNAPVTASVYYPAIMNFFKLIEKNFQLTLTIAAHPRSHYSDEKIANTYPGFNVVSHKTAELIKNCLVVFAHDSTAVSFACLYGKPIVFLVTDELLNDGRNGYLDGMIYYLGGKVINLDDVVEVSSDLLIRDIGCAESYRSYINEFVKCSFADPNKKSHEIIANHLLGFS
jgi:hypothetical protein